MPKVDDPDGDAYLFRMRVPPNLFPYLTFADGNLEFDIPASAKPGDYPLELILKDQNPFPKTKKYTINVKVKGKTPDLDEAVVNKPLFGKNKVAPTKNSKIKPISTEFTVKVKEISR